MDVTDRLSLKQIRYFTTIAESGSFRQAAFRLDVTQPALSNQIAILEKLLDLQLFERSKNGTTTTVQGRELLASASRFVTVGQYAFTTCPSRVSKASTSGLEMTAQLANSVRSSSSVMLAQPLARAVCHPGVPVTGAPMPSMSGYAQQWGLEAGTGLVTRK